MKQKIIDGIDDAINVVDAEMDWDGVCSTTCIEKALERLDKANGLLKLLQRRLVQGRLPLPSEYN